MSNRKKPRRGRIDAKGRSTGTHRYVMLYHHLLNSAAYRSLKPPARALLVELRKLYNGSNNGRIGLSVRKAATDIHVAKATASKAFQELQDKGFIKRTLDGSFQFKKRHSSEWELTFEDCDGRSATKECLSWRPEKKPVPK